MFAPLVHLDDDLHQVLLRDYVLAVHDLLQHTRKDRPPVHLQVNAFKLTQPNEIGPDENSQLPSLHLATFTIARKPRVLKSDPELVHFDEVGEDEADRVLKIPAGAFGRVSAKERKRMEKDVPGIVADWEMVASHAAEIVSEKETPCRVLHTARHLHHVLHNLLDRRVRNRHVDCPDRHHEVCTRRSAASQTR